MRGAAFLTASALSVLGAPVAAQVAAPVAAQDGAMLSDRVLALTAGLFCAPPEGRRRPAPDTMAGWVHVPDEPVQMVAEGTAAPAVLGLGFGVRYQLDNQTAEDIVYTVTHPPMPPLGIREQHWRGVVAPGNTDTVFFQFDTENELQPGAWSFAASAGGEDLFRVDFTVLPAADLPGLADLCRGDALLSFSPETPAARG